MNRISQYRANTPIVAPRPTRTSDPVGNKSSGASTPIIAKPIGASPLSGSPVSGSPVSGSPVSGSPVAGNPIIGTPVGGTPVAAPLSGGTPVASTPIIATPVAGTPISGTPISAPTFDHITLTKASVTLQKLGEAVAAAPVVDAAKVASVKLALQNGSYQIDAGSIADKLLQFDGSLK